MKKEIYLRKNNEIKEKIREFIGDENKFVKIRKKYPNSEINTKNYKGKTQKYEVKEKLKTENTFIGQALYELLGVFQEIDRNKEKA